MNHDQPTRRRSIAVALGVDAAGLLGARDVCGRAAGAASQPSTRPALHSRVAAGGWMLMKMAREIRSGRAAAPAAVAMARPSHLEGRLRAVLEPTLRRGGPSRTAAALLVVGTAAVVLALSVLQLEAKDVEPVSGGTPGNAPKSDRVGTMTVTGRVLDPDGKPVEGAAVDVVGKPKTVWVGASLGEDRVSLLARGETDGDGRFRVEAPRTSSDRFFEVTALSAAPGFALGWAELNPDAEQPAAEVRLRPEQPVRVKLVDVTGLPAPGVEVRVQGMGWETDKGTSDGIYLAESPPERLRSWPGPAMTDDRGQFLLAGIGRDLSVRLDVRDLRYARQTLLVETGSGATPRETAIALEPARIIEGRVRAADTGRPIPHAVIAAAARIQNEHANGYFTTKFLADAEGRFKINPLSSDHYMLNAFPPAGQPYLIQQDVLNWVKGVVKVDHDFKLPRGVLVRGKVTEAGTGRPLAGSSVQFIPSRRGDDVLWGWQAMVASGDDGVFQVVVPPGKGHLLVFGPTSDYVLETVGSRMIYGGKPGGERNYAHKFITYDVQDDRPPSEVNAVLRPGQTIKGRVVGPQGQTVTDAFLLTTLRIAPYNPSWRGDFQVPVRDGRFELHGLASEAATRVHILDPEHQWGATVEVSGRPADEEVTVTLRPCGQATARFLGPDGRPVAKHSPNFEFVATPGPHPFTRDTQEQAGLAADAEYMANVDRKHYWDGPLTDAEGRVTLPSLIPGALYRINDFSTVNDPAKGVQVRRDFTVKPGETRELGDILIEKPQP